MIVSCTRQLEINQRLWIYGNPVLIDSINMDSAVLYLRRCGMEVVGSSPTDRQSGFLYRYSYSGFNRKAKAALENLRQIVSF